MPRPRRSQLLAVATATVAIACLCTAAFLAAWNMSQPPQAGAPVDRAAPSSKAAPSPAGDAYAEPRRRMVREHLRGRDITDPRILAAMERVPRHEFVPEAYR